MLQLRGELSAAVAVLTDTLKEANSLIVEVGGEAKLIAAQARRTTSEIGTLATDVRGIVTDVKAGRGNIGKLITDDALYASATTMAKDAQEALASVRATSARLREAVDLFASRPRAAPPIGWWPTSPRPSATRAR